MPRKLRIASLGSSFAAGPSITPIEDEAAGRSSQNYAHQLAKKLNADLTDLSVSGATLLNVLCEKQITEGGSVFQPQLSLLHGNTEIVTITCGGNDIDYIGSLIDQTVKSYVDPKHPLVFAASRKPVPLPQSALVTRLEAVLDEVHRKAPKARVYLVQYLSIIGTHTRPIRDISLSLEHVEHFDYIAQLLAEDYVEAARSRTAWVEVVPVAMESREHGIGSPQPWVRGFSMDMLEHGPAPYHPNLAGHTAVAEMLYARIVGDEAVRGARL